MSPRTLFTIIVKILGVYLLLDALVVISGFINPLITTIWLGGNDSFMNAIIYIFFLLLTLGAYILVIRYCLFKTDYVIDKLALDKHFAEEKLEINVHRSTVLSIAVIVIGALLFIDALPSFCKSVFNYVGQSAVLTSTRFGDNPSSEWLIIYGLKMLLGYVLMSQQRFIVNFIERQRSKKTS